MRGNDKGSTRKRVSIVVPCYNEEEVLPQTSQRLSDLTEKADGYEFELVFVDDGSSDRTYELLRELATARDDVRVLTFSRNFGHQIAVSAGIDAATGDCVVLMDADLQDPPEVIFQMIEAWEDGYDVVYGVREQRSGETRFKLASARMFYRVLNRMSDVPIPLDTGDFRLMSRPVVDTLKEMPEKHRFVRGMVSWAGFRQLALPYQRHAREAGVSKYPLRKMIRFASDGIVSFSSKPLRIATGIGVVASALALLGIAYALALRVFTSNWVEGWTALMMAVLFMGGVQLICLGVIGEYVGRVYEEAKNRPLYIVRERLGFPDTGKDDRADPETEGSNT